MRSRQSLLWCGGGDGGGGAGRGKRADGDISLLGGLLA